MHPRHGLHRPSGREAGADSGVKGTAAFASKLPHWDWVHLGGPGRPLGRLAVDVDLGAPLTAMAERGHAEPRRGTEWWGKALLVTFGWSGSRLFQK